MANEPPVTRTTEDAAQPETTTGSPEAVAPGSLTGWASLQQAVNRTLPQSLNQAAVLTTLAYRELGLG